MGGCAAGEAGGWEEWKRARGGGECWLVVEVGAGGDPLMVLHGWHHHTLLPLHLDSPLSPPGHLSICLSRMPSLSPPPLPRLQRQQHQLRLLTEADCRVADADHTACGGGARGVEDVEHMRRSLDTTPRSTQTTHRTSVTPTHQWS